MNDIEKNQDRTNQLLDYYDYLEEEGKRMKEIYTTSIEIIMDLLIEERRKIWVEEKSDKGVRIDRMHFCASLDHRKIRQLLLGRIVNRKKIIKAVRDIESKEHEKKEEDRCETLLYFSNLMIDMILCG